MAENDITGGCLCGAVRYAVRGPLHACNLCHCRMCQKASGGPYMVFASFPSGGLTWVSGEPRFRRSSAIATRGFCGECGTPLTYQRLPERISLSIGSLDEPGLVAPTERLASETVLPWCETVGTLPITSMTDWLAKREAAAPTAEAGHP